MTYTTTFATIVLVIIAILIIWTSVASANSTIGIDDGIGITAIPITVKNATNVGSIDVTLSFDQSMVSVGDVDAADMDSMVANHAVDGEVRIIAYQSGSDGLNGDFTVAVVKVSSVGNSGDTCKMCLDVRTFKDASPDCLSMKYDVCNGTYTVYYDSGNNYGGGGGGGTYPPVVVDNDDIVNDSGTNETINESMNVVNESPTATPTNGIVHDDMILPKSMFMDMVLLILICLSLVILFTSRNKNK